MSFQQAAERLVGIRRHERREPRIQRNETDLDLVVANPEGQIVLGERSVAHRHRAEPVSGLAPNRGGTSEEHEKGCQVTELHALGSPAAARILPANSAIPSPDRLLVSWISSGSSSS